MSTMSTVTALAAHDHTLGNGYKLLNCMCVPAIARDDGTPFDAASVQEEDIIELCVEVGWAHPMVCYGHWQQNQLLCFDPARKSWPWHIWSSRPWLGMKNLLNSILLLPLLPILGLI